MSGTTRSSEGLDGRRKRILFRAWHRGMREVDLLLGRFVDARIATLTEAELDELERLMEDVADKDILDWLTDRASVPAGFDGPLIRAIRAFHAEHPAAS